MNEHEAVRSLLPLAASGDISPEEMRRVQEHIAQCESCRSLDEELSMLTGALRDIPTPQPRPELLARTRVIAEVRLRRRRVWFQDSRLLVPLVSASWIVAVATWPLVRVMFAWVLTGWQIPGDGITTLIVSYSLLGLLLACVSVLAVGRHARERRRIR